MLAGPCGEQATSKSGVIIIKTQGPADDSQYLTQAGRKEKEFKIKKKINKSAVACLPLKGPRAGIPPIPSKYLQISVGG